MKKKIAIIIILSIFTLFFGISLGSVHISLEDFSLVLKKHFWGSNYPDGFNPSIDSILWTIRIPRTLVAYFVGGLLAIGGAVMQSILQNPLASSYTMGVSAGASLGAACMILINASIGNTFAFMLPLGGFAGSIITIFIVIFFSFKLDKNVNNHTIILIGMIISLFTNAILSLLASIFSQHRDKLILWQLGSFVGKRWIHVYITGAFSIIGFVALMLFSKKLDIISFGEEQAMALGVDAVKTKIILIIIISLMTGVAVCFTGIIGFVDLAAPHLVRKIFGAKHKFVLPLSYLSGGILMVISDLLARTLASPRELSVGCITAFIGAPFFLWIYFGGRKK